MKLPPETKPVLMGAVCGAIAIAVVGFAWGGWVTGGTAEKMAGIQADAAVVSVLAPICADKFQKQSDSAANLTTLRATSLYQQATFIEDGGWAIMAGSEKSFSGTAKACGELLKALPK